MKPKGYPSRDDFDPVDEMPSAPDQTLDSRAATTPLERVMLAQIAAQRSESETEHVVLQLADMASEAHRRTEESGERILKGIGIFIERYADRVVDEMIAASVSARETEGDE